MHRRAVLFARASRQAREQRRWLTSTTARAEGPAATAEAPASIAREDLHAINRLASRVIKATGEGSHWPGWKQSESHAEDALWRDTRRAVSVASEKKEQFMARSSEETSPIPEGLTGESVPMNIERGSFVELRRNNIATIAIMLDITGTEMRRLCRSLTASGEIFEHDLNDAMWVLPGFVDLEWIAQCGVEDTPDKSRQHKARVKIVTKLRNFERRIEDVQHRLAPKMSRLYERVRNSDPSQWAEIKTTVAAQILAGPGEDPDRTAVFATHRLLMAEAFHYVCHPSSHRVYQTFLVRPLNEVENHKIVLKWFREPDNAHIASFTSKAKLLLQHHHDKTSLSTPKPITLKALPRFDENDQRILLFLRQASMARRSIQHDWYSVYAMKLLKSIGFYQEKEPLTSADVFKMLKAIGVLVPWEDDSWTRPQMFMLSKAAPGTTAIERRHEELAARRPRGTTDTSVLVRPPRDQLYPRDLMEKLRHDFGRLPVYIIDDLTATELDDGLSVERIPDEPDHFWLHVHIADPTTELHPNHELSEFARQIGTTVYYRHRTWLMLPHALAMGRFSLGAPLRQDWPKDKPMETLTFSAKVNQDGDILETKVTAGYIRNPVVLTYEAVDRAFGPPFAEVHYPFGEPAASLRAPPVPESGVEDLQLLRKLTDALRAQRLKKPIFSWQLERPDVAITESSGLPLRPYIPSEPVFFRGYPQVRYGVKSGIVMGRSAGVVSEGMITAARIASRSASTMKVPLLRRHAPPASTSPEALAQIVSARDEYGYVDPYMVVKLSVLMPAGSYTLRPAEHGILGIPKGEGYARTTSPLRRYLDLVTHWQLKAGLLLKAGLPAPPLFEEDLLRELAAEQGTREAENGRAMAENERFWTVDYIQRVLDANAAATPPRNLIFDAVVISSPELDMRNRTYFVKAHVPELGVFAYLDGIDKDATPVSMRLKARITHTKMGPPRVFAERA